MHPVHANHSSTPEALPASTRCTRLASPRSGYARSNCHRGCGCAAEEMRRVLRPGGQLLLLDHARSSLFPVRSLERVAAPLVQSRTGVDLRRDPVDYLADLGFSVVDVQRAKLGVIEVVI